MRFRCGYLNFVISAQKENVVSRMTQEEKTEKWRGLVGNYRGSGLSKKAWCGGNGKNDHTFAIAPITHTFAHNKKLHGKFHEAFFWPECPKSRKAKVRRLYCIIRVKRAWMGGASREIWGKTGPGTGHMLPDCIDDYHRKGFNPLP